MEHAIIQLVDKVLHAFKENKLQEALSLVDHSVLLRKLSMYVTEYIFYLTALKFNFGPLTKCQPHSMFITALLLV